MYAKGLLSCIGLATLLHLVVIIWRPTTQGSWLTLLHMFVIDVARHMYAKGLVCRMI